MKPKIQEEPVFADDNICIDWTMLGVRCGKCNALFGLTTGSKNDLSFFRENYNFCYKCGTPVEWE